MREEKTLFSEAILRSSAMTSTSLLPLSSAPSITPLIAIFAGTTSLIKESRSEYPNDCNIVVSSAEVGPIWRSSKERLIKIPHPVHSLSPRSASAGMKNKVN